MRKYFLIVAALLSTQQTGALLQESLTQTNPSNLTGLFPDGSANSIRAYPASCAEATAITQKSGLYTIQAEPFIQMPFLVYCEAEIYGGGWTVVQRRESGVVDFYRNWNEYKVGFGSLDKEFWLGLDKLHALTTSSIQELLIVLEDSDSDRRFAKHDAFAIGDEQEQYALKVLGKYSGDAGDSLRYHEAMKFETLDVKNSPWKNNCAVESKGAWWYNECLTSDLNGLYLPGVTPVNCQTGVIWETFRGWHYSLSNASMMIRPRRSY